MPSSYNPAKVDEALMRVRMEIGDTNERALRVRDEEITAILAESGVLPTDPAEANRSAVLATAITCGEKILAGLAMEAGISITEVGPVKSNAASTYNRLTLEPLRRKADLYVAPSFLNTKAYPVTYVEGVDAVPAAE